MGKAGIHVLYMIAGLLMPALFAGCGGSSSSTPTVPATATIFYAHSLAFRNSTTNMAWGYNAFGQLGDGSLNNSASPVKVSGLVGAKGVAIGADHSLAFFNNSTVRAWGYNGFGQLGNGSTTFSNVPVPVKIQIDSASSSSINLTGVTAVAAGGFHSLALKNDGTVWSWGENTNGQLGNGANANATIAQPVSTGQTGVASINRIAAGGSHSLALDVNGHVWAWGYNGYGQLGNNSTTDSNLPVQVLSQDGKTPLSNIIAIAAGGAFSVAVDNTGAVWAWGYNGFGQLGDETLVNKSLPVKVTGITAPVVAITAGLDHVLALDGNGAVWAWGYNGLGQLGNNTTINSSAPVKLLGFIASLTSTVDGVSPILAAGHHTLARQSDGTLWAWGDNAYSQLGFAPPTNLDTFSSKPIRVNGM